MRKILLLSTLAVVALVGCGRTSKEFDVFSTEQEANVIEAKETKKEEDGQQSADTDGGEKDQKKDAELEDGKLKTELKFKNDQSLIVLADVDDSLINDRNVYRLKQREITEAYLEDIAKKIFDGGAFTNAKPYRLWTKEELTAEKERFKEMDENDPDEYSISEYRYNAIDSILYGAEGSPKGELAKGQSYIYEFDYSSDAETKQSVDNCIVEKMARLRGTIDGKEYELCYENHSGEGTQCYTSIWISPLFPTCNKFAENVVFKYFDGDVSVVDDEKDSDARRESLISTSDITADDCINRANQIMDKLGISYTYSDSIPMFVYDAMGVEEHIYGYDVTYEIIKDDTEIVREEYMDSYVSVKVTKDGLVEMTVNDPYESMEVLTEKVKVIPVEQAVSIAQDYISENNLEIEQISVLEEHSAITKITLVDSEWEYNEELTRMPTWIFGMKTDALGREVVQELFQVNAVDGSIRLSGDTDFWCERVSLY